MSTAQNQKRTSFFSTFQQLLCRQCTCIHILVFWCNEHILFVSTICTRNVFWSLSFIFSFCHQIAWYCDKTEIILLQYATHFNCILFSVQCTSTAKYNLNFVNFELNRYFISIAIQSITNFCFGSLSFYFLLKF